MNVEVIKASELGQNDLRLWSELAARHACFASPYFMPQFTLLVSQARDDVYVGILRDSGRPIGYFPFQRRARTGGPVGGPLSDFQGVIASPDTPWNAEELIKACGMSIWRFDHLIVAQKPFQPYHAMVAPSPGIDVSAGYHAYVEGRREAGTKLIKRMEQQRRQLERREGPLRVELCTSSFAVLRQLMAWKSHQYRRTKVTDVFGFHWTRELLEHILATDEPAFAGMLSALYAGERLVAAHMGMRSRTVWHYWFPAYDTSFSHYSPGLILLLEMIKGAKELGLSCIDLGKGDSWYKTQCMNKKIELAEGTVEAPSVAATIRRVRRRTEAWIRQSRFHALARVPARVVRLVENRNRFR